MIVDCISHRHAQVSACAKKEPRTQLAFKSQRPVISCFIHCRLMADDEGFSGDCPLQATGLGDVGMTVLQ
jgi:hypothetical protein